MDSLKGKKTYIMAAVAVLTAVAQWAVGDADLMSTAQHVFDALMLVTLRSAVNTVAAK